MSLQHESHTVQTVSQTEDSPPRLPISRRLSVIFEKVKAEMASSSWILVLHTISWWLLGLTLIIAVSVFTYLALYISLMPSEVKLFKIILWLYWKRWFLLVLDSWRRRQFPVYGLPWQTRTLQLSQRDHPAGPEETPADGGATLHHRTGARGPGLPW